MNRVMIIDLCVYMLHHRIYINGFHKSSCTTLQHLMKFLGNVFIKYIHAVCAHFCPAHEKYPHLNAINGM